MSLVSRRNQLLGISSFVYSCWKALSLGNSIKDIYVVWVLVNDNSNINLGTK